ncbi:MAG: electron transfer flavoprotein-ubiquinone oxidoreductase [Planctomycetes bacterium]|nr:electron transfer flavoprotein-ubiquinone oxidoreductase [Planctomycetota bacterium]
MEREQLSVDVLFVGAGPANLAAAYRLAKTLEAQGREAEIAIIEKGQSVGDHILSGGIMDPRAVEELFGPDWRDEIPVDGPVRGESVFFMTETLAIPFPIVPPTLHNEGCYIVSLSKICAALKDKLEAMGVMICEGFPGKELLFDGDRVVGVRTMDMGLDRNGQPGPSFQPGTDMFAKVTVLGEGTRGSLTKSLVDRLGLAGPNPQIYGTGIKEIWDIPAGRVYPGQVWHSAGWPLTNDQYGGSWMYAMSETRVSIGFVSALDSGDPTFDPYQTMQRWKTHPKIKGLLEGGSLVRSGAKTVPEGGYWSRPRSFGDGFLIIGDSGSLLNIARLKGIHTAIKSGMLAADTIVDCLALDDFGAGRLSLYESMFEQSWLGEELRKNRNFRAYFQQGFWAGGLLNGIAMLFGGRIFRDRVPLHADCEAMKPAHWGKEPMAVDGKLTFDKVTGVYNAGAIHEEQQPSHLVIADTSICVTRCAEEYGNPCESFCPADVYEIATGDDGGKRMQINFSNCVHCKTCDVADPYQLITWTVPTDAGGPKYMGM